MNQVTYIKKTVIFLIVLVFFIYFIKKIIDYIDSTTNSIDETKYFPKNEREYQITKIISKNPVIISVFGIIVLIIFGLIINFPEINLPKINISKLEFPTFNLPNIWSLSPVIYSYSGNSHRSFVVIFTILILLLLCGVFVIKSIPKTFNSKVKEQEKINNEYKKMENINQYLYLASLIAFGFLIIIALFIALKRDNVFSSEIIKSKYHDVINSFFESDPKNRF